MPLGDFVNFIPAPVFLLIHITAFAIGAYFAWRSFNADASLLGWGFSLFALAEISYMTYHLDWGVGRIWRRARPARSADCEASADSAKIGAPRAKCSGRPTGEWPSGKAPDSGSGDRRFESFLPSHSTEQETTPRTAPGGRLHVRSDSQLTAKACRRASEHRVHEATRARGRDLGVDGAAGAHPRATGFEYGQRRRSIISTRTESRPSC